jgi:hypothetical protein
MFSDGFSVFPTRSRSSRGGAPPRSPDARRQERQATEEELRERYEAYCQWQAELLPTLIPRDAVRPLHRQAMEWALERGLETGKDPLQLLRRYCRTILPLPPFEEWVRELRRNPQAFLEVPAQPGGMPGVANASSIVAVRGVDYHGGVWTASLTVQKAEEGWRGFVGFTASDGRTTRTADIFLETSLDDVRDRFWTLEPDTLSAFLRSSLP